LLLKKRSYIAGVSEKDYIIFVNFSLVDVKEKFCGKKATT